MARLSVFRLLAVLASSGLALHVVAHGGKAPAAPSFVVPAEFPSSIFPSYYYGASPTREPQPAVYDPVLHRTFPLNLTDPNTLPQNDTDPVILPPPIGNISDANAKKFVAGALAQINGIMKGSGIQGNCSKCIASLNVLQSVARVTPGLASDALVEVCKANQLQSDANCEANYGKYTFGSVWTQVLAYADVNALDGEYICHTIFATCQKPAAYPRLNTTGLFPKPKPSNPKIHAPSGKRVKVLHMSDLHIDARYAVGEEANCTNGLCCRTNAINGDLASGQVSLQAPLHGSFKCDTPYFLATAALQSVHPLTGTDKDDSNLGWTIYTGDLVSHESQNELSRDLVLYSETSIYSMFHSLLRGTVFAVLGNHDGNPEAQDAPHSLPGPLGEQMSWNFDHISRLWRKDGWISRKAAKQARLHYGGYSIKNHFGLRIITLNTDFWYHSNIFNHINVANPDVSGMQHWLIEELQAAEDAGERVWILGHVLTGWDGTNPFPNPTELFYAIVERYSPHVIANIFFGHTHEDQLMVYYANNGTNRNDPVKGAADALMTGWIGPSVTPLTNVNSGFRMYEVDTGNFEVYEAYTWFANVSAFPNLNVRRKGPTFEFEYSTRAAYTGSDGIHWPKHAPLNATFWHKLSVAMDKEATQGPASLLLTQRFNTYQGKSSVKSPVCNTTACAHAKACYMRSGSAALGQECPQGYGSVQSPFKPTT